jgi:putative ABC transport system substrate-binding protein
VTTRAQQGQQKRRIGVLLNGEETDPEQRARLAAFQKALQDLGWTSAANLQIDIRYGTDDDDLRKRAQELVALSPDLIFASTPASVIAVNKASRTVPIVFAAVTDPVGIGLVKSLAHPGGNATGFLSAEFGFTAKWLELLKEIAPDIRRVGIVTDQNNRGAAPQFAAIQTVAPSLGVELFLLDGTDGSVIERDVGDFARTGNGGLIALRIAEVLTHRDVIIKLAAQYRLPAVYPLRIFAADGGLASYGPDLVDQFRQSASYVDRVLKGEKPADLPVQAPTKLELVLNLKTAKSIGLAIPQSVQARADEVIE